jgi:recombination DNA repair RAD52 pathway protein
MARKKAEARASRAREDRMAPTESRVEEIRRLMVTQAWGPEARAALALKWGVGEKRVSTLASEASRSLRVDEGEIAHHRETMIGTFREIVRHAMSDTNVATAKYLGVAPPETPQQIGTPIVINVSADLARAFEPPPIEVAAASLPEHVNGHSNGTNGSGSGRTH